MRELRLTTVITTDGHFRQVGFDVLPALGLNERASPALLTHGNLSHLSDSHPTSP